MKIVNDNLKIFISKEEELEKLNHIFQEESKYFMKIEGEIGPSPDICFAEGWYPINKSKNDFMMLSCYKEETLIGWITLIKEYPKNDIVYISHFSIVDVEKHKGYGHKIIDMLCCYLKKEKIFNKVRILVSLKNWSGIRFWHKCGFNHITCTPYNVSYSEETFASIELEKSLSN
ncbi:GNAT family N-acetyltransferase [Clostridium butyricum]|uniref:GNAT family N-acetyltransferase n=1 Tax=Clostridium butyricum TaxID=1492 RepID=UPI0024B929A1|nr:GNAT family N-acetyltransferase [Clostridium butyricum]